MSRKEIFVFRHGETDWNKERRFQGHTDIPLNAQGRAQAEILAKKLVGAAPQIILTSDLLRAKQTAQIVNAVLQVACIESPELRECKLGDAEGLLRDRFIEIYGTHSWERWLSVRTEDLDFGFPNGETKRDQLLRIRRYLSGFFKAHPQYTRIALSSHGGSLRRMVHSCMGAPGEPVPLPNCVLYKVIYTVEDGHWRYGGPIEY